MAVSSGETEEDEALHRRVADGDRRAYAMLVTRHSQRFYRLAFRYLQDGAEAEDMVQDAMIKYWEKPWLFDPARGARFTTWMHRVVVNQCLDRLRKHMPDRLPDEWDGADEAALSPHEELEESRRTRWLTAAIRALPARQQEALNLVVYEQTPQQEAAGLMGLSVKALESLLSRAKQTLKEQVVRHERS